MQSRPKAPYPGDLWGGLAAMLVALPSAIAFGVTIYAAIGPTYAAYGALAGMIGASVLGLIASSFGGTDRLISAPCAPAAAVLTAFAIEQVQRGAPPSTIILMLMLVGMMAGLLQMLLGAAGVGGLIRYIPYPVVSGYLTGVGLLIVSSQASKVMGVQTELPWWQALWHLGLWDWRAVLIGTTTIAVAIGSPRLTQKVPGMILGMGAGMLIYALLAWNTPALQSVHGNPLIVGPLNIEGGSLLQALSRPWHDVGDIGWAPVAGALGAAVTLAVLLSIDTLKTCVVLDQMTNSRHEPNRELMAQGAANLLSNALGGTSGAGTMGATLVALNSGAKSRATGVVEGVFTLIAALLFSTYMAWIPVAALAGILVVVGIRMIDLDPLRFLKSRSMVLDFAVVVAVVTVALTVGLIAASAVGVGMAMLLFVRAQIGSVVVRHKMELWQTSSSWHRSHSELRILQQKGNQAIVFELQGNLFFGNTYQLYTDLEHEVSTRSYVLLDLKRVQSIDVTAGHVFNQIRDTIRERGATLVLSGVRENKAAGQNFQAFFGESGLWRPGSKTVRLFQDLDVAIAWVEDRLLGIPETAESPDAPLPLCNMDLFSQCDAATLSEIEARLATRRYDAGAVIYRHGDAGDGLYWVRSGTVRLVATLEDGRQKTEASFGSGDMFGGLAFMDRSTLR